MLGLFSRRQLDELTEPLPRAQLLQRGRVAVVDDEKPEMLDDLKKMGLSIDHLASVGDQSFVRLEEGFYDLALLDYGGVGGAFGPDEGLDVLRHLRRVNPGLRILAFTGRTFDASKADFFRNCNGVVKKDSGIRELLETIEFHLAEVMTPAHHWNVLRGALGVSVSARKLRQIEKSVLRAKRRPDGTGAEIKGIVSAAIGSGASKAIEATVEKLITLAIAAAL